MISGVSDHTLFVIYIHDLHVNIAGIRNFDDNKRIVDVLDMRKCDPMFLINIGQLDREITNGI